LQREMASLRDSGELTYRLRATIDLFILI